MKRNSLACKIICAVTSAVMFALPLAACGDDEEELHGVRVPEKEWENRFIATYSCRNYTCTTDELNEDGKSFNKHFIKFNIDKNIIYYHEEKTNYMEYTFLYPYLNRDDYFWIITVQKTDNKEWQIGDSKMESFKGLKKHGGNGYNITYLSTGIDGKYKNYTFNTKDGSYITNEDYTYDSDYGECKVSHLEKRYYTEKYFFAVFVEYKYEYKSDTAYNHSSYTSVKSVCTDFGKTSVKVPANVKSIAEEYKTTHEPPAEEDEW